VLLSPWLDILDFDSETYTSRAALDPMVDRESNIRETERYFGPIEQRRALAPLAKDMAGLPPILIQMGDCEVLLGEAQLFANKARAAGVDVQLDVWPEMWHVFQALTNLLPEAKAAVVKIGEYIRSRMPA
jgi:epsilon-lactone hydrolase